MLSTLCLFTTLDTTFWMIESVIDWVIDWLIDFRLKLQTLMSWMKSTYKTKSTPEGISLGRSLPSPQSQLGVEDLGGSIILQGRGLVRNDSPEKGTRTRILVFFFYHRGLIRNRLSFSTYIYWMKHKFGTVIFADRILLQFSEEENTRAKYMIASQKYLPEMFCSSKSLICI